jgi:hypothetical protein
MKAIYMSTLCLLVAFSPAAAQQDKEQLALAISKAEDANYAQLKEYIWKRKSDVSVDGQVKLTTVTEFSFDEKGELQTQLVDAKSDVKQKPGLRGKMQENAVEDKADYVQKALELALAYTFMSKGELLDFFTKATVTEKDGLLEATATDVYVKGDKLTVHVNPKTNLFVKKSFSSLMGKDPVSGELLFEPFSNGINHGTTTVLDLPAQKMKINSVNQDYTKRVK